ncbi:alpha/beta fold hydrolase [Streptomyces sp. NPDC050315]|uniref:alpha/beta fold hydrolase n=1 Tax=Streptomyces sp. NPDC050315 TaxID=3155039 RepID=UPI00341DC944
MKALPFLCCLIRPSAAMLRVTVWELAVLAGHLLLYPTGVSQEQAEAVRDAGRPPSARTKPGPKAATATATTATASTTRAGTHKGAHAGASAPRPDAWSRATADAGASAGTAGTAGTGRPVAETDSLPAPAMLPTEGRSHPPVLLLHGFIDNRSVFVLLRRSLRRHGWCHLEALNYSPLTCDIRKAAELLGRHVEDVCERTGHRRIDLVGHSLGGLIARYYVQRLGGDARIRTLVTLGTPHGGTRLAALLPAHPLVRQMRPDSDVIKELARPAPNCRTSFVCFWSDLDQMMVPTETAQINHADLRTRNIHVSGVGHLAFPVNGTVAAGIREALASTDPTNPAQSENPGGAADEVASDQASVA